MPWRQLWISWGIEPKGMLGHSLGEYVAACLAGVFNLEDALMLVAERGRLIQSLPPSTMLAVPLSENDLQPWLTPALSLAVVNGVKRCVVGGLPTDIATLQEQLGAKGIKGRVLQTSHAFHSHLMSPILPAFRTYLEKVTLHAPTQPYLSNTTGTWINAEEAINPDYWCRHLRQPVRFIDNISHALEQSQLLLEVGPGHTLSTFIRQHPHYSKNVTTVLTSLPSTRETTDEAELKQIMTSLGQLWAHGASVNWDGFYQAEQRHRIPLPTYPFERQCYCIERVDLPKADNQITPAVKPLPVDTSVTTPLTELTQQMAHLWSESLGVTVVPDSDFFELGGDSLLATQVIARMNQHFGMTLDAHILLQAPTVRQLAKLIENQGIKTEQAAATELSELVVTIQAGHPQRQPLILLHPVGGHVYFYRELTRHLDPELPVYGIRAVGLEGEAEPLTTIAEMAKVYTAALKTLQSTGPYHLAGASFGGTLAYAIAQHLIAQQETIAFLGLIDTPSTNNMPVELEDNVAGILFYLLTIGHKLAVNREDFMALDESEQFDYFFQQTQQENTPAAREELSIVLKLFRINMQAMREYQPGPYPGKIHFFLAKERDAFNAQTPAHGWIPLAEQGIEIYTIPGDHISMNEEPQVRVLAHYLRQSFPASLMNGE
jgi:phthiocerol/phenolphthiocerol synthesis type-I polyketide synthase E